MNIFFHGNQLLNTLYYFRWSGKFSFVLEKCPAVLENFPDNKIFFCPEKQLSNTHYYFRWSGKISSDLEKFPEILEKFPDHMNLFFNEKELSKRS